MNERFEQILESIQNAPKEIRLLPLDEKAAAAVSENFSVKPESLLGTIIFSTGGIVVENWLRIYGSGEIDFRRRNLCWQTGRILVAEDIIGGLFGLAENGTVEYFAPDALAWEDTELPYNRFLYWAFYGDTDLYYRDSRWEGWREETKALGADEGIAFYPFLWAESPLESRSRQVIPMDEIVRLEFETAKKLGSI